jgi:hypothetical protein
LQLAVPGFVLLVMDLGREWLDVEHVNISCHYTEVVRGFVLGNGFV